MKRLFSVLLTVALLAGATSSAFAAKKFYNAISYFVCNEEVTYVSQKGDEFKIAHSKVYIYNPALDAYELAKDSGGNNVLNDESVSPGDKIAIEISGLGTSSENEHFRSTFVVDKTHSDGELLAATTKRVGYTMNAGETLHQMTPSEVAAERSYRAYGTFKVRFRDNIGTLAEGPVVERVRLASDSDFVKNVYAVVIKLPDNPAEMDISGNLYLYKETADGEFFSSFCKYNLYFTAAGAMKSTPVATVEKEMEASVPVASSTPVAEPPPEVKVESLPPPAESIPPVAQSAPPPPPQSSPPAVNSEAETAEGAASSQESAPAENLSTQKGRGASNKVHTKQK